MRDSFLYNEVTKQYLFDMWLTRKKIIKGRFILPLAWKSSMCLRKRWLSLGTQVLCVTGEATWRYLQLILFILNWKGVLKNRYWTVEFFPVLFDCHIDSVNALMGSRHLVKNERKNGFKVLEYFQGIIAPPYMYGLEERLHRSRRDTELPTGTRCCWVVEL